MPTLRRGDMQITVPDEVVDDYRANGWAAPRAGRSETPDDTWTVEELRAHARELGITYKGLNKAALLKAFP